MMMAKVIYGKTNMDAQGNRTTFISALKAEATPEEFFEDMEITGRVESYKVTNIMPLEIAMMYVAQLEETFFAA